MPVPLGALPSVRRRLYRLVETGLQLGCALDVLRLDGPAHLVPVHAVLALHIHGD